MLWFRIRFISMLLGCFHGSFSLPCAQKWPQNINYHHHHHHHHHLGCFIRESFLDHISQVWPVLRIDKLTELMLQPTQSHTKFWTTAHPTEPLVLAKTVCVPEFGFGKCNRLMSFDILWSTCTRQYLCICLCKIK